MHTQPNDIDRPLRLVASLAELVRAFTLVEVVVVAAIVGIAATISMLLRRRDHRSWLPKRMRRVRDAAR